MESTHIATYHYHKMLLSVDIVENVRMVVPGMFAHTYDAVISPERKWQFEKFPSYDEVEAKIQSEIQDQLKRYKR